MSDDTLDAELITLLDRVALQEQLQQAFEELQRGTFLKP